MYTVSTLLIGNYKGIYYQTYDGRPEGGYYHTPDGWFSVYRKNAFHMWILEKNDPMVYTPTKSRIFKGHICHKTKL